MLALFMALPARLATWTNSPCTLPPKTVSAAMNEGLNQYPPMTGVPVLREAISAKIKALVAAAGLGRWRSPRRAMTAP